MKVCVFLSAANVADRYVTVAREVGKLLGMSGHTLVWGGSSTGLMKVIADQTRIYGGYLFGVSVTFLSHVAREDADAMVIAPDLAERKTLLLNNADAVIALAGGTGTLDELANVIELKKHGKYHKPIIVINTEGFYDGLQVQLNRMSTEGFLPVNLNYLVNFFATCTAAFDYLNGRKR